MEGFNIIDYKSQVDSLTTYLINEYMKLEKHVIDIKKSTTNELADMNKHKTSISALLQGKENQLLGLEKEIEGFKFREQEYKKTIDNKEPDNKEPGNKEPDNKEPGNTIEPETETNKFDLLRGQAKEITAKDKEIKRLTDENKRLTDEICKLKQVNDIKLGIEMLVEDKEDKEKEEDTFYIVTYRKNKYYKDKGDKIYDILDDDEVGAHIGSWVKGTSGKYKLVKN